MVSILGIDPGTTTIGWAIVEKNKNCYILTSSGIISTTQNRKLDDKLLQIYNDIQKIIRNYNPKAAAIEQIFFAKNVKTALKIGEARGAILVALREAQISSIFEYTPLEIKNMLCGYGRADKYQVQKMVKLLLNLNYVPKPDDVSDAIAVALCGAYSYDRIFKR